MSKKIDSGMALPPLPPLPPELSDAARQRMREAARGRVDHAFGAMSDEWVADGVRMLMRNDLWHEAICTAARDRIMSLSLELEELRRRTAVASAGSEPVPRATAAQEVLSGDAEAPWCCLCNTRHGISTRCPKSATHIGRSDCL